MQRLSLGLATLALVCCLAMLVFVWQSSQAVIASQSAQREMLMALEKRLYDLGSGDIESKQQPAEWNKLSVKLVYDDEAKTPVHGAELQLKGTSPTNKQLSGYEETTSDTGEADFGLLLYGNYSIDVVLPSGIVSLDREVVIRPGQDKLEVIVCPKTADQEIEIAPIELPEVYQNLEYFADKRIWFALGFHPSEKQPEWHGQSGGKSVWIGPEGCCEVTSAWQWENLMPNFGTEVNTFGELADPKLSQISRYPAQYAVVPEQLEFKRTIRIPLGNYTVTSSCQMWIEKEHDGKRVLVGAPQIPFYDLVNASGYAASNIDLPSIQKWSFQKVNAFRTMEQLFLKRSVTNEPFQVSNGDLIRPVCQPGEPLLFWLAEQMPPETALVLTKVASKAMIDGIGPQDVHLYVQNLREEFRPNEVAEAPATIMLAEKENNQVIKIPVYKALAATSPGWIIARSATSFVPTTYDPLQSAEKSNEE